LTFTCFEIVSALINLKKPGKFMQTRNFSAEEPEEITEAANAAVQF
jgi:hypothetical protein